MWRFDIAHLPGSANTAADVASRHPATSELFVTISGAERDFLYFFEEALLASVRQNKRDELTLNWDEIARHTVIDAALNDLLSAIQSNFDVNFPPKRGICQYLPYRDFIFLMVLLYTMTLLLFRRNSAIKYYALYMPPIRGCRPWNGVRAQPFSSRR